MESVSNRILKKIFVAEYLCEKFEEQISKLRSKGYSGINEEIIWISIGMGITIAVLITIALCYIAREKCRKRHEGFTSAPQSRRTSHELITSPSKWNVKSMVIPSKGKVGCFALKSILIRMQIFAQACRQATKNEVDLSHCDDKDREDIS
ncbi:hypothetical protein V1478_011538, partial [Vespula squamosa]